MTPRGVALALLAATVLVAAGCGGNDTSKKSSSPAPSSASTAGVPSDLKVSTDLSKKPTLSSPAGLPPEKLATKDVVAGSGKVAKVGDNITVQYVGVSYSTDKEFDSSWSREPFQTMLASPGIIEGWVKGIAGMKVGGRRVLVIPPDLGYGAQGQPPDIGAEETLIFVIDLKKVG